MSILFSGSIKFLISSIDFNPPLTTTGIELLFARLLDSAMFSPFRIPSLLISVCIIDLIPRSQYFFAKSSTLIFVDFSQPSIEIFPSLESSAIEIELVKFLVLVLQDYHG